MDVLKVGFRIKQAIGLTGLNVSEFCEKTSRSRVNTALWISGRGGLIAESKIRDLCCDLRTCGVICDASWILSEIGNPPSLDMEINNAPEKYNSNKYNLKDMLEMLSSFSDDTIFNINTNDWYAICNRIDLKKAKEGILGVIGENFNIIGYVLGICKKSNALVLRDSGKNIVSIDIGSIKEAGSIIFLFRKNP